MQALRKGSNPEMHTFTLVLEGSCRARHRGAHSRFADSGICAANIVKSYRFVSQAGRTATPDLPSHIAGSAPQK